VLTKTKVAWAISELELIVPPSTCSIWPVLVMSSSGTMSIAVPVEVF
jgi:hypothetical protein